MIIPRLTCARPARARRPLNRGCAAAPTHRLADLRDGDSEGARTYAQTPEIEHISAIIKRLLAALECELPGRPPAARPVPQRSLAERDQAARKILRERFKMHV